MENPNLVSCPDCYAKVSRRATTCPHCGAPLTRASSAAPAEAASDVEETTVFVLHPSPWLYGLQILGGILLIPLVIGLFILLKTYIAIHFTVYKVTTRRVVVQTGWLNRNQVEIWVKDMRAVNLRQDLWQRIIGIGDVAIGTAATGGTEIQMHGLRNAQAVVDKINALRR